MDPENPLFEASLWRSACRCRLPSLPEFPPLSTESCYVGSSRGLDRRRGRCTADGISNIPSPNRIHMQRNLSPFLTISAPLTGVTDQLETNPRRFRPFLRVLFSLRVKTDHTFTGSHPSRCSFYSARLWNVCPFRALFFAYLKLLSTLPLCSGV